MFLLKENQYPPIPGGIPPPGGIGGIPPPSEDSLEAEITTSSFFFEAIKLPLLYTIKYMVV
jgi:hypothetical protein